LKLKAHFFFIILSLGAICKSGSSLEDPILLKEDVILKESEMSSFITDIYCLGQQGLVLGAYMDECVYFYSFKTRKLKQLARKGQGPGELNGGYNHISIFKNEIYIQAKDFVVSSFDANGFKRVVYNAHSGGSQNIRPICWVPGADSRTAFVNGVPHLHSREPYSLAVFSKNKTVWKCEGPVSIADLPSGIGQEQELFRLEYTQGIVLVQASTPGFFYRVPCMMGREIEVRDNNAQLVRRIKIPNPKAKEIPIDLDERVAYYTSHMTSKFLFLLWTPAGDGAGNLHVMLPKYSVNVNGKEEKRNHQYIFSYSEQGKLLKVSRSPIIIKRLAPSYNGNAYYGIDINDDIGYFTPE